MIIIDYPPGGLGNFLAQCAQGSINENSIDNLSFHNSWMSITYDYHLVDKEQEFFAKLPLHKPTSDLVICHSWGRLSFVREKYPDSYIVQVIVKDRVDIYLNNLYRKTYKDEEEFLMATSEYLTRHWDKTSFSSARRIDIASRYIRSTMTSLERWHHSPDPLADAYINFDNLYQDIESMSTELKKIGSKTGAEAAWNILQKTQKTILDKVKLYPLILNNLSEMDKNPDLDDIDKGIIIGMWARSQCEKHTAYK